MMRRLILCAFVALSFSSARATDADVSAILYQCANLRARLDNFHDCLISIDDFLYDESEPFFSDTLARLGDILDFLTSEGQYLVDSSIILADTVSSNFPQVQEDVAGILGNIQNFTEDLQTILDALADIQGATQSAATQVTQINGSLSDLNQEITQQHIAETVDLIHAYIFSVNDGLAAIARNTMELLWNSDTMIGYYDNWDEWFFQQFDGAFVPYTSLSWYSLDGSPWLLTSVYRPKQNTLTFGSSNPDNFFKDLADILVTKSRITSDIADSILFICSQLSNTNQISRNAEEFQSDLDDTISSANDDKSILDNMTFGFDLQTPSQFDQIQKVRQLSKYSVNSLPGEDFVISGFEGYGNHISYIQGNLRLNQYASFFYAIRGFFSFLYWGIFIIFIWKLFRLILRLFVFFKFQSVNSSQGLFTHNDHGFIV